jgi:hypothetical protein
MVRVQQFGSVFRSCETPTVRGFYRPGSYDLDQRAVVDVGQDVARKEVGLCSMRIAR